MSGSKSLESQYQKKTPLEHVLLRPDSYVGSVLAETKEMWVYDEATNRIVEKEIVFVPALYKIFDEILVNAADNFSRDRRMNRIDISTR
jgi:DNA topoisomerase-2